MMKVEMIVRETMTVKELKRKTMNKVKSKLI